MRRRIQTPRGNVLHGLSLNVSRHGAAGIGRVPAVAGTGRLLRPFGVADADAVAVRGAGGADALVDGKRPVNRERPLAAIDIIFFARFAVHAAARLHALFGHNHPYLRAVGQELGGLADHPESRLRRQGGGQQGRAQGQCQKQSDEFFHGAFHPPKISRWASAVWILLPFQGRW